MFGKKKEKKKKRVRRGRPAAIYIFFDYEITDARGETNRFKKPDSK